MGLIGGLWLLVLGVLGAANLVIAARPDAKQLIGKLSRYQGWIGVVSAFWGAWGLVSSLLHVGWLARFPLYWATYLAVAIIQCVLGLLLGVGVMKSFVSEAKTVARLDETVRRLAPKQGLFGLVAIGLGLWMIVASVLPGLHP